MRKTGGPTTKMSKLFHPLPRQDLANYKNGRVVLTPQLIVVYRRKKRLLSIYALLVNLTVYNML